MPKPVLAASAQNINDFKKVMAVKKRRHIAAQLYQTDTAAVGGGLCVVEL